MPVEAKPLFRPDVLRARLAGFALPAHVDAFRLEHHLSDLVNAAYHLTPDEIALLWQTAPPRMPIGGLRG